MRRPRKQPWVARPALTASEAAEAIAAGVAAAEARAVALTKLGAFAAKHGVAFDISSAITGSVSLAALRRQVAEAMADASEAMPTLVRSTSANAQSVNLKDGWNAALSAVSARLGLAS